MGPLLTFLAKQTGLQKLTIDCLSDEQQGQIRQTVSDSAPNCEIEIMEDEESSDEY